MSARRPSTPRPDLTEVVGSVVARLDRLSTVYGSAPNREGVVEVQTAEPQALERRTLAFLLRVDAFLAAMELSLAFRPEDLTEPSFAGARYLACFQLDAIASGHVHSVAQLKYFENDLLMYWNEALPSRTSGFWAGVRAAGLPYERKDYLGDALRRGRIRSRTEYDVAVDSLVAAVHEGRLSQDEASRLSAMIDAYEQRRR